MEYPFPVACENIFIFCMSDKILIIRILGQVKICQCTLLFHCHAWFNSVIQIASDACVTELTNCRPLILIAHYDDNLPLS